jgi:hypothetical protein
MTTHVVPLTHHKLQLWLIPQNQNAAIQCCDEVLGKEFLFVLFFRLFHILSTETTVESCFLPMLQPTGRANMTRES